MKNLASNLNTKLKNPALPGFTKKKKGFIEKVLYFYGKIMSKRIFTVNSTLQKELAVLFRNYVNPIFPQSLVTITEVDVSNDLQHGHIYVSILGKDAQKVLRHLNKSTHKFHQHLRKRLTMKYLPKLQWFLDTTPKKAQNLSDLIDQINNNET